MKTLFASFVFLISSLTIQAQTGVYFHGILGNSPGFPVDIILDLGTNPPISAVVTADASGIIAPQFVEVPEQDWEVLNTSFLDCDGSINSQYYLLDSLDNITQVAIYPWYCLTELLAGCTDPNANNFDPQAIYDDGSCEYGPNCTENLVTVAIDWDQDSDFEVGFYDFFGNSIGSLSFSNIESGTNSICLPNGCYAVEFFYSNGSGVFDVSVNGNLNYVDTVQTAAPNGGATGFNLAINSTCTPNCYFPITTSSTVDSCLTVFSIANVIMGTEVLWTFGDGTSAMATNNVVHNFGETGTYQICASFFQPNCGTTEVCTQAFIVSCNDEDLVFGCTDSTALNYNALATYDDGSCTYGPACDLNLIEIQVQTQYWAEEISWTLLGNSGEVIAATAPNAYANYTTYATYACVADGCYQFLVEDTYGDGWNSAAFIISVDGVPTLSGTLTNGFFHTYILNVNSEDCTGGNLSSNDLCANATPLMQGITQIDNSQALLNENIYGACWGFGQGEGEQSSVWYSFTTPSDDAFIHIEAFGDGTNSLTDTQFGLFQQCNGEMIYCDGNSGDGLFSAFTFQCGQLDTSTTYILMIDGWNGDAGTCYLNFEMTTGCNNAIYGCTDASAINYNPAATIDDGSCDYSTCDLIEVVLHLQANVLSDFEYQIMSEGLVVESAIVTTGDMMDVSFCLPAGCYSINLNSFGNTVQYELSIAGNAILSGQFSQNDYETTAEFSLGGAICGPENPCNSTLVLYADSSSCTLLASLEPFGGWLDNVVWSFGDGQIDTGAAYSYHVYNAPGNYTVCATFSAEGCENLTLCDSIEITCPINIIWGCTDPAALNYNPLANYDDGSCNYGNAECMISFDVIADSTGLDVFYVLPSNNIFAADSVLWNFGDGTTSTDLFPTHEYTSDGPFNLCLTVYFTTDSSSCIITYCALLDGNDVGGPGLLEGSFTISILEPEVLAIAENNAFEEFRIWPNPTLDNLHIQYESSGTGNVFIRLVDITGRTVIQQNSAVSSLNRETIDVSALSPGVYLVVLESDMGMASLRVVVGK